VIVEPLDDALCKSDWGLLMEFPIPRRQQRIDLVVLARDIIFVVEFKSGLSNQRSPALHQVEDYALDLADFHAPSHGRVIVPIVVESRETQRDDAPFVHNVGPVIRSSIHRPHTSPQPFHQSFLNTVVQNGGDRTCRVE
jgi:hypothetical protein